MSPRRRSRCGLPRDYDGRLTGGFGTTGPIKQLAGELDQMRRHHRGKKDGYATAYLLIQHSLEALAREAFGLLADDLSLRAHLPRHRRQRVPAAISRMIFARTTSRWGAHVREKSWPGPLDQLLARCPSLGDLY